MSVVRFLLRTKFIVAALVAAAAFAQDVEPGFAVATIKLSDPNVPDRTMQMRPGQFATTNTTLAWLIAWCSDLQTKQITGVPSWVASEKYDITARPDVEGRRSLAQWKAMVRKLLAERFGLAFHRERKELSVYSLTVLRSGPKLTPAAAEPGSLPAVGFGPFGKVRARNASMLDFARHLQNSALDRPVIDRTGLTGRYDFALSWTPDEFQYPDFRNAGGPQLPSNAEGVDLFTAIQQQLGLKLEAARAPAEVIVVDHVERLPPISAQYAAPQLT